MTDIKEYMKELTHLKSLGLLEGDELNEINNLITTLTNFEKQEIETQKETKEEVNPYTTKIKYVNTSENSEPIWAKKGDSGFDLRANLPNGEKEIVLKPFERLLIPTGLYFELPIGFELQIRPRSGHSFKTGLMAILGTVDTGYRGEVKVIMINLSNTEQVIVQGERIAQGVVASRVSTEFGELIKLNSVEEMSETERGSGGFGSTGNI